MHDRLGPRLKYLHCCTDQAITNALGQMDLTSAQGHILVYLSHQELPPCPKDIEEAFHLTHPTVSGLLNRLEKKEFIALQPDEKDKRCKRVCLLPKGQACLEQMHQAIVSIETQMVQGFTPEEQQRFIGLLDRAIKNMGGELCRPCHKEEPKK